VKEIAIHPPRAIAAPPPCVQTGIVRRWAAAFWLWLLFFCVPRCSWFVRWGRPFFRWWATRHSRHIQHVTMTNARRIYGADISDQQCRDFAWRVTENFYSFIADVGRAARWTPREMREQVASVEGRDRYLATRSLKRGAIIVTAHMGSFEVGLAALRELEPKVHVVFRRDLADRFDAIRQVVRRRLGVIEHPVDEGLDLWIRLRDALVADEVVVIQGDRVMPGQKGQRVPFLGHHIMLPTGPIKLAQASGAPVVPIFSLRRPDGKIDIVIEDAIDPASDDGDPMVRLAKVLETQVALHAEQWLVFQPAFCEDSPGSEDAAA
jgi:KDO2-lipid IV(A) lauroyltransferase